MRRTSFSGFLGRTGVLALTLALQTGVLAGQAVNVDRAGLALSGYDAVAYFSENRAVEGSPQLTATHAGATYRFRTSENRDAFVANPERYLPAYGGYCAYGVAQGHKVKVDPEAFRVVDDRLYLNYSKGVQQRWLADIPGQIALAERNWPKLKDAPRD